MKGIDYGFKTTIPLPGEELKSNDGWGRAYISTIVRLTTKVLLHHIASSWCYVKLTFCAGYARCRRDVSDAPLDCSHHRSRFPGGCCEGCVGNDERAYWDIVVHLEESMIIYENQSLIPYISNTEGGKRVNP